VVQLSKIEWKWAWKWKPRTYQIKIGDKVAYLYNQSKQLLNASPFTCNKEIFNMNKFTISCIHKMTKKPKSSINESYSTIYQPKQELTRLYSIPIEDERFYKRYRRLIQLRKRITIQLSTSPNDLGYYYASITQPFPSSDIELINTDPIQLLEHLFLTAEFYIERDRIPVTLSESWFKDYKYLGHHKTPETIARHNVESSYYNSIYDAIESSFRSTDKTSYISIYDLFDKNRLLHPYTILYLINTDPHLFLDENDFVIYEPTIIGEMS